MKKLNRQTVVKAIKITAFVSIAIVILLNCAWYATHYTREAIVKQTIDDSIIIVDTMDNLWLVHNDNNYRIGDKLKITIYTNGTDLNTDDDVIEKYKPLNN